MPECSDLWEKRESQSAAETGGERGGKNVLGGGEKRGNLCAISRKGKDE